MELIKFLLEFLIFSITSFIFTLILINSLLTIRYSNEIAINNLLTWLTDLITTVESKYLPRQMAHDIDLFQQTASRVGLLLQVDFVVDCQRFVAQILTRQFDNLWESLTKDLSLSQTYSFFFLHWNREH